MNKNHTSIYELLKAMPPLSHYPDRTKPFDWADSLVLQHIASLNPPMSIRSARAIFEVAHRKQCIRFDQKTRLWSGNPRWVPQLQTRQKRFQSDLRGAESAVG